MYGALYWKRMCTICKEAFFLYSLNKCIGAPTRYQVSIGNLVFNNAG